MIKQHGRPSARLVGGVKPLVDPRSSSDTLRPPDDDDQIIIMVNMIVIMMIMMIMMMIINFSRMMKDSGCPRAMRGIAARVQPLELKFKERGR